MAVYRLWDDSVTPAGVYDDRPGSTGGDNLGTKFTVSKAGWIVGLRYYRPPGLTSGQLATMSLYTTSSGTALASISIPGTATGWQEAFLPTPVAVSTGVTYVTAFWVPVPVYGATTTYFNGTSRTSGFLTAPATGSVAGGNGVYDYNNSPARPGSTFNGNCYFADVIYSDALNTHSLGGLSDTQYGHFLG